MSNDILFYTQIVSIVIFIFTLFGLYKILIEAKNAKIELLEEKIEQLDQNASDILLKKINMVSQSFIPFLITKKSEMMLPMTKTTFLENTEQSLILVILKLFFPEIFNGKRQYPS